MTTREAINLGIDRAEKAILEAERHIWENPESGYREWKTHAYLKEKYEELGYEIFEAGNIPGFYCYADTGREGPCIGIFGELDSLIVPTHPECDKETGAVHSCGHNCQSAALYGVAAAFKTPGALDGLCGKIKFFAVPAEELIELEYREELRQKGIIRYFGGKPEFMARGYLDDVDIGVMIHTTTGNPGCPDGSNGCIIKRAEFKGKAVHASTPYNAHNALYAANTALSAANSLRETFRDEDSIRFHPIITAGGSAYNSIPDFVAVESYIRGRDIPSMKKANEQMNRAFAGAAAAIGCGVKLLDHHGYAPRLNDDNLQRIFAQEAGHFFEPEKIRIHSGFGKGCSDFGDVSCVMPAIHPHIGGAVGTSHGSDYYIRDPYTACVISAKVQAFMAAALLENDALEAKKVLKEAKVPYASIKEYLASAEQDEFCEDAVVYNEDGTATLRYTK